MKRLVVLILLTLVIPVYGLELVRQKNVATVIVFPLESSADNTFVAGEAAGGNPDTEIDQWSDSGDNPDGFADAPFLKALDDDHGIAGVDEVQDHAVCVVHDFVPPFVNSYANF